MFRLKNENKCLPKHSLLVHSFLQTLLFVITFSMIMTLFSCDPLKKYDAKIETDITPIKDVFKEDFIVGAAIEPNQLEGAEGALLRYHFSGLTAENAMKFKTIHPKRKVWSFEKADKIVKFARKYDMKVRGHAFVWHHPAEHAHWAFLNMDGSKKSREETLEILEEHITTLMDRYKDDVYCWDVVNEAIDEYEKDGMRKTEWYRRIGPDYVAEAFKIAHKADPKIKLFYNDYENYKPNKRKLIKKFIKGMLDDGVPIHGIGMQLHISNGFPSIEMIEDAINDYRDLGLEIHITELDISMYAHEYDKIDGTPSEAHIVHQAYRYKQLMELFRKNKDVVTNVTLWGYHNGHTWLTGAPYNRPDWPFPFNDDFQSNLSYKGITLQELPPFQEVIEIHEPKTYEAPMGTVNIDANMDAAWKKAPIGETDVITTGDNVSKAKVRTLWDKKHLYFLLEVEDDDMSVNAGEAYMNDSVEVFIDENNAKTASYEEGNDFQLRVDYENKVSVGGYADKGMIKSAAKKTATGYIVEIAFALQSIEGKEGAVLGIDYQVNNNDGSGSRVAIAKWNDFTNESWRSTAGWGTLKLVK
ncbi:MAG: endo-1,4-beta-xylanase [Spirochaetes bacterium]|nr:endo-1,4-beta-xylanase [Spirochaetota bacterium]MBN2772397.1 endo-1,4-beta-xylanase [Spirochaetota bacterium]